MGNVKRYVAWATRVVVASALAGALSAQTSWYVDAAAAVPGNGTQADPFGGYSGIQVAINAAADGDTIWVEGGSYGNLLSGNPGFIDLGLLDLELRWTGSGGRPVIEPAGGPSIGGIMIDGAQSSATLVEGFVIRGHLSFGTPAFTIQSLGGQGGDHSQGSHPRVRDCRIEDNVLNGINTYGGGGMGIGWSCRPVIEGCVFSGNIADASVGGGAVWVYGDIGSLAEPPSNYPHPVFLDCEFVGNRCLGQSRRGGAIKILSGSATIVGCEFRSNTATDCGGALYANNGPDVLVQQCEFESNVSLELGGGGVYASNGTLIRLVDCTLTGNTALEGGAACAVDANLLLDRCCLSRNSVDQTVAGAASSGSAVSVRTANPGRYAQAWVVNSLVHDNQVVNFGWGPADLERRAALWAHADTAGSAVYLTVLNSTVTRHAERAISLCAGPSTARAELELHNSIAWDNGAGAPDPTVRLDVGCAGTMSEDVRFSDCDQPFAGAGNQSVDPLFLAPQALDFHLDPSSPCVDAGDDGLYFGSKPYVAGWLRDLDKDLQPRLVGRIDLGCYENP